MRACVNLNLPPRSVQVLADQTGLLELDGCDFRKTTATSMVKVQDGGNLAIVRNARLSTGNYRAVK